MINHSKKSLRVFIIVSAVALMSTSVRAERLASVSFLSSSYQSCTGHCEKENIDCSKGSQEHGSTQWCKKNCLNSGKADEYQFIQGINYCRTQKTES